jgi:hypothetical protein
MEKTWLERAPARQKALRSVSLLLGTGLFLHAAPAWAVNECGPPPPGGGTVTCPAGEYPNGIDYLAPSRLEVLLDPGVVTRSESRIETVGDLRIVGPANTKLNSAPLPSPPPVSGGPLALLAQASGTLFVHVDDLTGGASLSGVGSVTFIADRLSTPGGTGVLVQTTGAGETLVRINSVSTAGFLSPAINVSSPDGDIRVEAGTIRTGTHASPGIVTRAGAGSNVFIESRSIETSGEQSHGIDAFGGAISIVSDSIVASGTITRAIVAQGETVTIVSRTIQAVGVDVEGGIRAGSNGDGAVTVTSGNIVVNRSKGIFEFASGGIQAFSAGSGTITVDSGSISTTSDLTGGIGAFSGGDIAVTSGIISTTGARSIGITAMSGNKAIRVTSGKITTLGTAGIGMVISAKEGVSIISDSVATAGANATAIEATSSSGQLNVTSNTITTRGPSSVGISATGNNQLIIGSGTIATSGANSPGIRAGSGPGPISVTSGSITTAGGSIGMEISTTTGDINVTSGSVVTQGAGTNFLEGTGIYAHSVSGKISVSSGSVSTTGTQAFGIFATSAGDVNVTSNMIATTGPLANAIFAISQGGSIDVHGGPMTTLGDSATGVVTFVSGPGTTSVRTGAITTQGFDSYGVIATSTGTGAIDVTGDGSIVTTGASSPGISAESGGKVTVSGNNISTTGANSDAIAVKGSTSAVTIKGLVQSSQGFAVRGEGGLRQRSEPGGPVTVNIVGGGTLRGRVSLTGAADRITNSGIFDAIGASQFGAGSDVFENNTGATVRSTGGAATFAGLETFSNRGTIEMRDGTVGDSLTLGGAYGGAGAALLGLDVDFTAGTADRLITGAATGSTQIGVQGAGGGFTSGILLVDAGAGTSPTAFTLAGSSGSPYLSNDLRFDPANNDFLLVRLPGTAVFETSRFGGMATQLWHESADAVAAQLDTMRDAGRGRGMGLWLQGWTGERERNGTQTLAGAGTFDVSFEQDFQGLQGGFDFRRGGGVLGITAGAGRSDATFALTGNPVDMNVWNIGLYAQGRAGPLWVNALAKHDWAELEIAPGAGLGAQFDAQLFGIQANAGLRLGGGPVFAEPSVGLSWVQADLDSFASGPATVEPGIATSLRARAGLRAGARLPLGGGALLPFVAANVYEEIGGRNESDFTLGETLRLFDEPAGTRGQAAAGISFAAAGFEAFVRGETDFSGGADAKAVRAGARLRF